jgi:hypothetical protein
MAANSPSPSRANPGMPDFATLDCPAGHNTTAAAATTVTITVNPMSVSTANEHHNHAMTLTDSA